MALLWLAVALFVVWLLVVLFAEVAGFAIHLLLFAAALAVVAYFVRKGAARTSKV
ncbi:hypothetical protein [Vulgatibacter sp.]|uniref:hypothetical protein n=1 Tax=Vulgatibacter sp. TaxID=1971226 RepID=UPI0035650CF0